MGIARAQQSKRKSPSRRRAALRRAALTKADDRKKQILRAAVEVFAERGFHRTRVSDIARRADVAYGLVYHYFKSKDQVLNSIFDEKWALFLKVLDQIADARDLVAIEKLRSIADVLIDALRIAPELVQVVVQEISRSDRFGERAKLEAFHQAVRIVERIITEGQKRGELKVDFEPRTGAFIFFGALETVCTGFALKALPCRTDEDAAALKKTLAAVLFSGMAKEEER